MRERSSKTRERSRNNSIQVHDNISIWEGFLHSLPVGLASKGPGKGEVLVDWLAWFQTPRLEERLSGLIVWGVGPHPMFYGVGM